MNRLAIVVVAALLALPSAAGAQRPAERTHDEDPLLGTWSLNVSRSTYVPGPRPLSQTRVYRKHRFGIEAVVKTVYGDGRSTTVQSVFDYDAQEHPVTGAEDVDTIVMSRTDAHTHVATLSHAGSEIGSFRREISRDGKQMTVTLDRKAPPTHNVEVYEKVVVHDE